MCMYETYYIQTLLFRCDLCSLILTKRFSCAAVFLKHIYIHARGVSTLLSRTPVKLRSGMVHKRHMSRTIWVCVCALFFQKATFVANESLLGSFPDKSIPWKATFVANEGLLGTYMVPWKASFVVNEALLVTYMVSSLVDSV